MEAGKSHTGAAGADRIIKRGSKRIEGRATIKKGGVNKTNIRNASPVLGYMAGIPLKDYTVIKTGENATGPIAQDLLKTNPELVRQGDDGYYQVSELSQWTLVKAIQELKAENQALKEQNQIILMRLNELEAKQ